ncbi:MAG: hypothetical protein IPG15_10025 [Arcobacter sp.]|nr:hypothetical protein [Arcobacter sp.]
MKCFEVVDEIEMKLGDIEKNIRFRTHYHFLQITFKSHSVAFIPNEPIVDATFNDNREKYDDDYSPFY